MTTTPEPEAARLSGTIPILVTPFTDEEEIDYASLEAEIEDLATLGITWVGIGFGSEVQRLTGEELHAVIDAVGKSITRHASTEKIRPGGVAMWLGLEDPGNDIDVRAFIRSEKSIRTSFCYTNDDFAEAVRIAAQIDASFVEVRPLADGAETFYQLMAGRTDLTKVALQP